MNLIKCRNTKVDRENFVYRTNEYTYSLKTFEQ